jgi:5-(carboxyamino)imidazole ribonucleotide mutase
VTPQIGILMGSDSDAPAFAGGLDLLKQFAVPFDLQISSAHRTPQRTLEIVRDWEARGVRVIIAAAGGAAHLAGVVAGHTLLPVLGVPMSSALLGLDSLLAMAQMPGGIPVATFGIGEAGATNAVLFALSLLAVDDEQIKGTLADFRRRQADKVADKSRRLREKLGLE